MARFKYERNLQSLVRCVGSTCHDGLLIPGVWDLLRRAPRGVGHPETHPRTRDAVGYAEYASRTLAPGLQLCKECSDSPLGYSLLGFGKELPFHYSGFEELPDKVNYVLVCNTPFDKAEEFPVMYCVKVAPNVSLNNVVMFVTRVEEGHNDRDGIHGATTFSKPI